MLRVIALILLMILTTRALAEDLLRSPHAVKTLEIADRVMVLSLGEMHLLRETSALSMSDITEAYHI